MDLGNNNSGELENIVAEVQQIEERINASLEHRGILLQQYR